MRRAIFTLNKMKIKYILFAFVAFIAASCNNAPKIVTYQDAEREFVSSLTQSDTLGVIASTNAFMESLKNGDIDAAISNLTVLDGDVLYALGDESLKELKTRFQNFPVADYTLLRYSFSTQGLNDVVYRYSFDGPLSDAAGMKLVFNPIKVGDTWYLSLKDGSQSSKDKTVHRQIHPMSPAPAPIKLNIKQSN